MWIFLLAFVFFVTLVLFIIAGKEAKPKMFELVLAVIIALIAYKLGFSEPMAYMGVGLTMSMTYFMKK